VYFRVWVIGIVNSMRTFEPSAVTLRISAWWRTAKQLLGYRMTLYPSISFEPNYLSTVERCGCLLGIQLSQPISERPMSVHTWTLRLAPSGSGAQPFSLYVSQMTSVFVYAEWHRQIARRPGTMTTFAASGQTAGAMGVSVMPQKMLT
jgi:hypothetical protein